MAIYVGTHRIEHIEVGGITNNIISTPLPTPTISVNTANGAITASILQATAAFVLAGTASQVEQLPTVIGSTITPNDTTQTLAISGQYTLGDLKVLPVQASMASVTYSGVYYPATGTYFSGLTVDIVDGDLIHY